MGLIVKFQDYAKKSIIEHKQILDAIREHESEKAKELMYLHIIRSKEDILTRYENQ